jgi:putative tryptophan/tyrosine transport system substrate-binding protein
MKKDRFFNRRLTVFCAVALFFAFTSAARPAEHRIGVLTPGLTFDPVFRGLRDGLARMGYVEGKNIAYVVDDTKGNTTDLLSRAEKLLASKPDVLFAVTTVHAVAAHRATTTVPIVFAWVGDPVQAALVPGYRVSKNNVTGVITGSDSLSGKRLEALLEVAPKTRRLLAIVSAREAIAQSSFRFAEETAKKLRVTLIRRDVTNKEEIENALRETPKGSVDAIYHIPSTLVGAYINLLIKKAKADRIPMIAHEESIAKKGALLSYGPDFRSVGGQAARLLAKVLNGEKSGSIPSEVPNKLNLVINTETAKAIDLKIPRDALERADRLVW